MHDFMRNTKLTRPTRSQDSFDIFGQYDWIIDPKWEIVGALRYDYFSDGKESRITPKINVCYRPRPEAESRLRYGLQGADDERKILSI